MAKERIGYRRLYLSRGVSIVGGEGRDLSCTMGDITVDVHLGPKPKLGVYVQEGDKYFVPGETATLAKVKFNKDATQLPEAGKWFTEIRCSREIEVVGEVSVKFHEKEQAALEFLIAEAARHGYEFKQAANVVAGIIGLRFHRQLVLELLDENPYVERGKDDTPSTFSSSAMELLNRLTVREEGVRLLEATLAAVGQAPSEARAQASVALRWLVLAWEDRNPVSKFLSLFIPLERVLEGVGGDSEKQQRLAEQIKELSSLVETHGGTRRREFLELIDQLARNDRPGLAARFETFAREAKLEGWEKDIDAFRRFNASRNRLLHGGSASVELIVGEDGVSDEEKQGLEDLAERYVCWAYFRDAAVYPSQWRQGPNKRPGKGAMDSPHAPEQAT